MCHLVCSPSVQTFCLTLFSSGHEKLSQLHSKFEEAVIICSVLAVFFKHWNSIWVAFLHWFSTFKKKHTGGKGREIRFKSSWLFSYTWCLLLFLVDLTSGLRCWTGSTMSLSSLTSACSHWPCCSLSMTLYLCIVTILSLWEFTLICTSVSIVSITGSYHDFLFLFFFCMTRWATYFNCHILLFCLEGSAKK